MSTIPSDLGDTLDELLRRRHLHCVAMEVNGVPVLGVPVVDLIEPALCAALEDSPLWRLFADEPQGTWRPGPDA